MVAVVAAAVVALAAPLLPWWLRRSGDDEAFGGLCVLVAAVVVGALAFRRPPSPPQTAWSSLVVGVCGVVAGVIVDVRIAQMAGVLCLAHAAVGVGAPGRLQALTPSLWLSVLSLPLSGDLDVVGFPARLFAARVAESALTLCGAHVVGAETVLVVEGNVADVEAPCAGLSTLRMLAAVVIVVAALRDSGRGRAVVALVVAGVVAVVGNALRVTALSLLVLLAHRPDFAALVHLPLGVLAFVGSIVVADLLLRAPSPARVARAPMGRAAVVALVVVAGVATVVRAVAVAPTPKTSTSSSPPLSASSSSSSSIPLTASEHALFGRHALWAEKRRVDGGSVLVVVATSLRAHHAPERCLAGSGLRVDASTTTTIAGVPVKRLLLDGGARVGVSFYVRDGDDGRAVVFASLLERTVDQLVHHGRGPWAFVSAVVDADVDVDDLVPRWLEEAHARARSFSPWERP